MWIKTPQRMSSIIHFLGDFSFCSYLFLGERNILFDAGVSALALSVAGGIKTLLKDRPLHSVVISHAHFEHVGMLPHLRRIFPDLEVLASAATARELHDPKTLRVIQQQNEEIENRYHRRKLFPHRDSGFAKAFRVDRVLEDGDRLALDERIDLRVLHVPGHAEGSLALFMPHGRSLFVGDALGLHLTPTTAYPEFAYDYGKFVDSVRRMEALAPRRIGMSHFGVLTEADALRIFKTTVSEAAALHERLVHLASRDVTIDRVCQEMLERYYLGPTRVIPVKSFIELVRQMLVQVQRDLPTEPL